MSERPTQPWSWLCEFCYRLAYTNILPDGWDWAWQSAICPECYPKVQRDGGYSVVKGGAYATRPDPRETFTVHAHEAAR